MSRILSVLKNKNSIEKRDKQRRREELNNLRTEAAFRARLHDDMKIIDLILSDEAVDHVIIEVPKASTTKFMRAIYGEEMAQYNIIQLNEQRFEIGRKMVNF